MYRWLWEQLPGGKASKALIAIGISVGLLALLFTIVFPWLELSFFAPPTIG